MAPILKMVNVTKRFPGVLANDKVNLEVKEGEIHTLLGENGAGKSTLMNILYGLYKADEGEVFYRGQKVVFTSAKDAINSGIGMIHQHFMLIPVHTVVENIVMGTKPHRSIVLDLEKAENEIISLASKYGLEVEPKAKVWQLSVGAQQKVEIIKALYRGARLLIMDEPTAVLTPQEVEELFVTLKQLAKQGMSIILITHKLSEVIAISDRITVLRDGRVIDTVKNKDTTETKLARLMVGRDVLFTQEKAKIEPGETVLEIKNVTCKNNRGLEALKNLNLEVKAGEILGIAGVDGNGQSELAEIITGLHKINSGQIFLGKEDLTNLNPRFTTERGIAHIPEDRHKRGLVLDFSISENCILQTYYRQPFTRRGLLDLNQIKDFSDRIIKKFGIKTPNSRATARTLSGGNQQKIVVARELERKPRLLVAVQPTRGVDVGAIEYIHSQILKERERGSAVLLISTELQEILALSDRIAVMYKGELMGEVTIAEADINKIGLMMAGSRISPERSASHAS